MDNIEEEYSTKLEELEKTCQKMVTKAEKNRIKMLSLETKYEQLIMNEKPKEDIYTKTNKEPKIQEEVLPMKLDNGKLVATTKTESTNINRAVPDKNKISHTPDKSESENSCPHCPNRFKSANNLKNHMLKYHEYKQKCTFCARSFSDEELLETHITSVHKKENSKHKIDREPSLANQKQK